MPRFAHDVRRLVRALMLFFIAGLALSGITAFPLLRELGYWRLIDCSFGVFGAVPLLWVRRLVKEVEATEGDLKPGRGAASGYSTP